MNICIFGTGYVGLVTGACLADSGHNIFCIDIDQKKIDLLNSGTIPIYEPGLEELVERNLSAKRIHFLSDSTSSIKESEVIMIAVGTPTNKDGSANLKYVLAVAKEIAKKIEDPKVIVTKSTVPVGTSELITETIKEALKENSKNIDFYVASNPEFLKEGDAVNDFMKPDRIIIGCKDKFSEKILKEIYTPFNRNHDRCVVMDIKSAELTKYASNAMLANKISFINELANLCEKVAINIEDVAIGMGFDKRIGSRFLRVGPAYGGSCFPKDTRALINIGEKFKVNLSIVKSVVKSNDNRRSLLTKRIYEIMSNKLKNKIITFLGVTFKPNTDDMRMSSSLSMIPNLLRKGAIVRYCDPSGKKKEFDKYGKVSFHSNVAKGCLKSDLIVIHTEWDEFKLLEFKKIVKKSNFKIFDMRNLYSSKLMKKNKINYFGIGK